MPHQKKLEIGKIVNTHGLKGEVKVTPWCDDVAVFSTLESVFIKTDTLKIENVKFHKNTVIIKFCGVNSIEEAERLRNQILLVSQARLGELKPDTYYIADLIGINVFERDSYLGIVEDCFPTGSNDVYTVRTDDGGEILVPAIFEVVKKIDIEGRRMDIIRQDGGVVHED